jgi:hypothetical protein
MSIRVSHEKFYNIGPRGQFYKTLKYRMMVNSM